MQGLISTLFTHERRALAEALHRDECRELVRAQTDPKWADWHKYNARLTRRLLDLIEPHAGDDQAMSSPSILSASATARTRPDTCEADHVY